MHPLLKPAMMLAPLLAAEPAAAQLAMPPSEEAVPSRLAPIDPQSPWQARFENAARALEPELALGSRGDWIEMFGGQWLRFSDRGSIGWTLDDESGAFRRVFASRAGSERIILGWQPVGGNSAYAALTDRPEGDAILCWRERGSAAAWPQTAAEAEDARAHACLRVSYSVRFDPPRWRAFIDAPLSANAPGG